MGKQTGIFECVSCGPGKPHLIGDDGCCEFCGIGERELELAFDSEPEEEEVS